MASDTNKWNFQTGFTDLVSYPFLPWSLDDAKEKGEKSHPALSHIDTHPAQVPLACHLITLDTARGLKYEKNSFQVHFM